MAPFQLTPHGDEEFGLEPAEVVLRFLDSVGRRADAEFYLSLFRAAKERFACICVDGPVLTAALDAVVLDLRFLATLGLTPVVILGLLAEQGSTEQASALLQGLARGGVQARVMRPDYFARPDDLTHAVAATTRAGVVPLVPLGVSAEANIEQRFVAMHALVSGLHSRKLIHLQRRGSLRHAGKSLALVNLSHDYAWLMQSPELSPKQRLLLREAKSLLLGPAAHRCTVAIASPLDLLRELFTVKGAGTLLRRGALIECLTTWDQVHSERLRILLESAFARPVEAAFFARPLWRMYVDAEYRGAAVVDDTPVGAYLSKFAVEREAQGEGIGGDLWERLSQENKILFWRSRRGNVIDAWYTRQCDGLFRSGEWNVFWKGLAPRQIEDAVLYATSQPADFSAVDVAADHLCCND